MMSIGLKSALKPTGESVAPTPPARLRWTSPSIFEPLRQYVEYTAASPDPIKAIPERDQTIQQIRRIFDEQCRDDLFYNLQRLREQAECIQSTTACLEDGFVQYAFEQLEKGRRAFCEMDAWSGNNQEIQCWNFFHQFYVDALFLADRLQRIRIDPSRLHRKAARRHQYAEGAASYTRRQSLKNTLEQGFPNGLATPGCLRGVGPVLVYNLLCRLPGVARFDFNVFVRKMRHLISRGYLANLSGSRQSIIQYHGQDEFLKDSYYFDKNGQTRHDIFLIFSHRHSTLDLTFVGDAFHQIPHACWCNELFFPRSCGSHPSMIMVRPGAKRNMDQVLEKSVQVARELCWPVMIFADGGGPYFPYGQQMRIKRGVRLMVDYLNARPAGTNRKAYLVPVSLDDPISFFRGLDSQVTITFHSPIDVATIPDAPPPDPVQLNYGDPLLNFLENLFLCHTGQTRHGWQTPDVIETTRRHHLLSQQLTGIQGFWTRKFHATICELSQNHTNDDHL